jgi:hypothetical protein
MQEPLSLSTLKSAATEFAAQLSKTDIPILYGVTDGKAVGTYVEVQFNAFITRNYQHKKGNAAKGIDFPDLNVDLKVTSIRQPQSSSPFRDATQKVYGLGYNLLLFVYEKTDDSKHATAHLNILHVIFIDLESTGDYQITREIRRIIDANGNVDDIDALLQDKNLPLDEITRRQLSERIMNNPPTLGYLTISNALQWRLQYGHAIKESSDETALGLVRLHGE